MARHRSVLAPAAWSAACVSRETARPGRSGRCGTGSGVAGVGVGHIRAECRASGPRGKGSSPPAARRESPTPLTNRCSLLLGDGGHDVGQARHDTRTRSSRPTSGDPGHEALGLRPTQPPFHVKRDQNPQPSRLRMTRQGLPAARTRGGRSRVTTLPAPTTVSAPIVTPGQTIAPPPSHAPSPMTIG